MTDYGNRVVCDNTLQWAETLQWTASQDVKVLQDALDSTEETYAQGAWDAEIGACRMSDNPDYVRGYRDAGGWDDDDE